MHCLTLPLGKKGMSLFCIILGKREQKILNSNNLHILTILGKGSTHAAVEFAELTRTRSPAPYVYASYTSEDRLGLSKEEEEEDEAGRPTTRSRCDVFRLPACIPIRAAVASPPVLCHGYRIDYFTSPLLSFRFLTVPLFLLPCRSTMYVLVVILHALSS